MTQGETIVALIGAVGTVASTAACLIANSTAEAIKSVSHRVGNIEQALIGKALEKVVK